MAVFEIPLSPTPQSFSINLAGVVYNLNFAYRDAPEAGWLLDIADANGVSLVAGIPLVTGADLLAQYEYLGIGGVLYVLSDDNAADVPTFTNLGVTSHLYFQETP